MTGLQKRLQMHLQRTLGTARPKSRRSLREDCQLPLFCDNSLC